MEEICHKRQVQILVPLDNVLRLDVLADVQLLGLLQQQLCALLGSRRFQGGQVADLGGEGVEKNGVGLPVLRICEHAALG